MNQNQKNKVKVILRKDVDMEHLLVYRNGILLNDAYEGFPVLQTTEILQCLKECGIIHTIETEQIRNQPQDIDDVILENLVKQIPFERLKNTVEAGFIFEFYSDEGMRIGVSYHKNEDNTERYTYKILAHSHDMQVNGKGTEISEHIDIHAVGTMDNPMPNQVIREIVDTWNKLCNK